MILIADSGSTKTEWTAMDDLTGEVTGHAYTKGLNPYFVTEDEIRDEIRTKLLPMLPVDCFTRIYFYGSGARDEKQPMIRQAISSLLVGEVTVTTDMLGAARALCGHEPGIVCILGTGANSCRYDGETIVANVPRSATSSATRVAARSSVSTSSPTSSRGCSRRASRETSRRPIPTSPPPPSSSVFTRRHSPIASSPRSRPSSASRSTYLRCGRWSGSASAHSSGEM